MRPKTTNFFQLKLENLFKAHQDAFKKHSLTESSTKKANLEEEMLLYESRILKMLSKRKETNQSNYTVNSSFFLINRNTFSKNIKHKKTMLAIKNDLAANFFIRKEQKISCDDKQTNLIENNNNLGFNKLSEYFDDKLSKEKSECEEQTNDVSNKNSTVSSLVGDEDDNESLSSNIDDRPNSEEIVPISNTDGEDQLSKIEFLRKLGLVTAEEYQEISNRKNSRKRRTTANPNFSNAAIEAKRQTKLEILAERKYRQRLAVEKQLQSNNINDENLILTTKNCNYSLDKSRNLFKIENKQLFPGLYLVKKMSNVKYYCKCCFDLCQCYNDSIIVCKMCSSFFHATCLLSKKDLIKLPVLNCPNCSNECQFNSSDRITQTEKNNLINRLNGLRDYIGSLTNATLALQLFREKKELEKVELLNDFNSLHASVEQILTNLNCGHLISSIKLPSASANQTVEANDVDNQTEKVSQGYLDCSPATLGSTVGRLEASLYSHPNKAYLDGQTTNCNTNCSDINLMSLCI